ncbi:MAG: carbon storage regulator CsrA [Bdellovibrionales bacterium]|nr:carbon storage regulator CsrA [Bdellovibrionales bacterium]
MLVLTRKLGESIAIDDHIKIRVVQIKGKQVRLGIEAPKDTKIHREEVYLSIQDQNKQSSQSTSEKSQAVAQLLKTPKGE